MNLVMITGYGVLLALGVYVWGRFELRRIEKQEREKQPAPHFGAQKIAADPMEKTKVSVLQTR